MERQEEMSEMEMVKAYGLGVEAMQFMAKIARQVKKQGGDEEDVRLLNEERIIKRVAKDLARAGRLTRPISVAGEISKSTGFPVINDVYLVGFKDLNFSGLARAVESWICRLATSLELHNLVKSIPDLLRSEDELTIVGEQTETLGDDQRHLVLTKRGPHFEYYEPNRAFDKTFLAAMIFV